MKDLPRKLAKLFERFWPYLLILAVLFTFFWKVFLKNQVPLPGDFVVGVYYPWLDYQWGFPTGVPVKNPLTTDVPSFMYPMQILAGEILREGGLPLWNPLILAGTPLLANFQSVPFTVLLHTVLAPVDAWTWGVILQHLLAMLFSYIFLRHLKVSKFASLFAAAVFAFSGFNLIWSQWNGHTLAASFIPLILLFADKFFKEGKMSNLVFYAFALLLQILSGYPQVVVYSAVAVGLLWLVRLGGMKKVKKKSFWLVVFSLLAFGAAAFQLLPGAELLKYSQREIEPHPFEWAFLPWKKVITFIAPDFFGNHATQNWWGPQDYTSNTGFVGVVALVLSLVSFSLIKRKKEVLFACLLLATALVLALPSPVSLAIWESGLLGFNAASAHRALVLFNFAVAVLVGFGFDQLTKGVKKKDFLALVLPFLLLVGFGLFAFSLRGTLVRGANVTVVGLRNLILPSFALGLSFAVFLFSKTMKFLLYLLLPLSLLELFYFGFKFTPFSPRHIVFPTTPVIEFLQEKEVPFRVTGGRVIPINMRMPYNLESLEGYDAVYPLEISQLLAAINGQRSGTDPLGRYGSVDNDTSPLLDLINVKYYLVIKKDEKGEPSPLGEIPTRFREKRFSLAFEDGSVAVLESQSARPRAFLVYDWEVIGNEEAVLDRMLDATFPYEAKVILEKEPSLPRQDKGVKNAVNYQVYRYGESSIKVETSKPGILFVSETDYPGWKVFVDGRQKEILRADFAFRAVEIPEGKHTVEFFYQPESFRRGLTLSFISLLAIGAVGLYFERLR